MSSNIIEGIYNLEVILDPTIMRKQIQIQIQQGLKDIHNKLKDDIKDHYNFPEDLDDVLKSPKDPIITKTNDTFKGELVYEAETLPLMEFPLSIAKVPAVNSIFKAPNIFTPTISGWFKRKKPLEAISVSVRKGKNALIVGAFTGKIEGKTHILLRKTEQTWEELPTEENLVGERAPYKRLYGPNILSVAEEIFKNNPDIDEVGLDFTEKLVKVIF